MTPPTEAEIREAIALRTTLYVDNPVKHLREVVEDFGAFMHGPAFAILESSDPRGDEDPSEADDIWGNDLRPSEAKALMFYFQEAVERAVSDARAAIEAAFVDAALRFAAEFPDAPRAKRQAVPA